MKRLVIVEDQTAIREMLAEILRLDPNYKLVGESGDGQSAHSLCLEVAPDLLVLDAKLPGLNGVDLLRRIRNMIPRPIITSGQKLPQITACEMPRWEKSSKVPTTIRIKGKMPVCWRP